MNSPSTIEPFILTIRGQRVILDTDLAKIYGVSTKRLNEQVKRNGMRFPLDFLFQLNQKESGEVLCSRSQFATLKRGMNIKYKPYAFTEYGSFMAANVLNSRRAISMSIYVIRAFVKIREGLAMSHFFEKKFAVIEKTLLEHDQALRELIIKIRPLMVPEIEKPKRRIGFRED